MFFYVDTINTVQDNLIPNNDWESQGEQIFFKKNKFELAKEELLKIKKLLIYYPPPLKYRRKVNFL